MNRDIVWTTQFKKDYKLALKRHLNIDLLDCSENERIGRRMEKLSVRRFCYVPSS